MKRTALILLAACCLACGSGPKEKAEVKFPEPRQGYVHDFAGVLSSNVVTIINNQLRMADKAGKTKMAVITVPSLYGLEISDFAVQLGKVWKVGEHKSDNGIIFILAPTEKQVSIEVGYGIEAILPDATCKLILHNEIVPLLKMGDYNGAMQTGVASILKNLKGK